MWTELVSTWQKQKLFQIDRMACHQADFFAISPSQVVGIHTGLLAYGIYICSDAVSTLEAAE